MELVEAREFVRQHHRAVLATKGPGDTIQQSPVLVTAGADGALLVSSRETAFKTKNLRRDPWAQLCVFTDAFFGPWVFIEGVTDVVALPGAMDDLVAYYRSISGEHPDWQDYRRSMREEQRVALRITPQRAGPSRQG